MAIEEHPNFEVVEACFDVTFRLSRLRPDQRNFVLQFVQDRFNQPIQKEPVPTNLNGNGKKRIGRPPKQPMVQ